MTAPRTMLLCVAVIALVVRAVFVTAAIKVSANEYRPLEGSDTPEYLHLARNFVDHGRYTMDDARSRLTGLYRTPIYPLYCAAIMKLGGGNRAILWSQVPVGAAACVLVAWLALTMFRSTAIGYLAGLLSASSPTGIGLTAMILVEASFELTMVGGFCCMLIAVRRRNRAASIGAGTLWALAGLIKPTLMFWPIAGSIVWLLVARAEQQRTRWRDLILCAVLQVCALFGWSMRNYVVEDYFSPSAVGPRNLRLLVVPMMEQWLRLNRQPTRREYYVSYFAETERQKAYLYQPDASATELVRREMRESREMILNHPALALRVYAFNLSDEILTGWNLLDRRIYFDSSRAPKPTTDATTTETALPLIWRMFTPLQWVSLSPFCQWLWVIATATSAVTIFFDRKRDGWQRRALFIASLWITVLYFAAFAGTIFRGGSRLMYPAEFAVILLICSNISNILDMIRGRRLPRAD